MERFALLMGCKAGKDTSSLAYSESDVDRVTDMLLRHPGWTSANIKVLRPVSTRQEIQDTLRDLMGHISGEDLLFVYFAGHAIRHNDSLHLVLSESAAHSPNSCYQADELLKACIVGGVQDRKSVV